MAQKTETLRPRLLDASRVHFLFVLAFAISVVVYDASQLIPPQAVLNRWKMAAVLLVVNTTVWYLIRVKESQGFHKALLATLVVADILFASFVVYSDRGMASLGAALYFVPIATSAVLHSRSAVFATASLCVAAYTVTCVKYFVDYFNEGYKVQLYSTVGFYSAVFFVVGLVLVAALRQKR